MSRTARIMVWGCVALTAAVPARVQPAPPGGDVPDFARIPPTEPGEAEGTFRVLGGFRMELIAAEPLVADPVDLAYDSDGRAYVVEFRGYPLPEKPDDPLPEPTGRVRLLEDSNGDGKFDRSDVFADGLQWPTSVALWKRGAFVAAPPDLWYFQDTDGDRKADVRRKVFTGFGATNVQAVMNNLRWGLDHWIYGAAAGNGGTVVPIDRPGSEPVKLSRRDFRFDAATEKFEPTSGGERFGNAFDDWGNRFLCNIRNPVQQVVLPSRYLDRNPHLLVSSAVNDVAESGDQIPVFRISPPEPWRVFRAQRWTHERANFPRSELVGAGYFTSSSGVTIYRGAAYPPQHQGNAFVADVAANIIHRETIEPDGVTFKSRRADAGAEFVASTDTWFRPVNFVNAPDGTLTVLDMYRETIEHPWSIPDDIRAKLDLTSGSDRGRLYRLAPPGFVPPKPPRLGKATTQELVTQLENPHAWWRETAHRLLFERQDTAAAEPLRKLLHQSALPQARLHALWSLEGMGALTDGDVTAALLDPQPHLRENAVLVSEPQLAVTPSLLTAVIERADDSDPRVRMQVAFTLGGVVDGPATEALARIARRDAGDRWIRTAVLSSAGERPFDLLKRLARDPAFGDPAGGTELMGQLALFAAARGDEEAGAALGIAHGSAVATDGFSYAIVAGIAEGLARRGRKVADLPAAEQAIESLLDRAEISTMDDSSLAGRLRAIDLLRHGGFDRARRVLPGLFAPRQPPEVRLAAVRLVGSYTNQSAADVLIAEWPRLTSAARSEAVEVLLRRPAWIPALLSAIEDRTVPSGAVPGARRNLLLTSKDESIRVRAGRIFGPDAPSPRGEVIARYAAAPTQAGDAAAGEVVFRRECAACHRLGDEGYEVGPSLTTVRHRAPEEILTHVLDPNRDVSPEWTDHVVVLTDGRVLTGLLVTDTASGVTLRRAQRMEESVPRSMIGEIVSTNRSLMPEGFERTVSLTEMRDLIAFLLTGGAAADPPVGGTP